MNDPLAKKTERASEAQTAITNAPTLSATVLKSILAVLQKSIVKPNAAVNDNLQIKDVIQNHKLTAAGSLFIAMKGAFTDGRLFARDAIDAGGYVVCDLIQLGDIPLPVSDRLFVVPNIHDFMKQAIVEICDSFKKSGAKMIAITGSSGKTTTKLWMTELLQKQFPSMYSIPQQYINYNSELVGPFFFLCSLPDNIPAIVMEIGVGKPRDMDLIAPLLKPDLAIVTNVGNAHLENFNSDRMLLIKEKLSICDYSEKCVVHQNLAEYNNKNDKKTTYFTTPEEIGQGAAVEAVLDLTLPLITATEANKKQAYDGKKAIHIRLDKIFQPHALENVAAILTGLSILFPEMDFTPGLSELSFPQSRGNVFQSKILGKNLTIFDSSYNANPGTNRNGSMYRELQALERLKNRGARVGTIERTTFRGNEEETVERRQKTKVGAILGQMLEVGAESDALHAEIAEYALSITEKVCFIGQNWPSDVLQKTATALHQVEVLNEQNVANFIDYAFSIFEDGDVVLIKGSKGVKLYDILMPTLRKNEI